MRYVIHYLQKSVLLLAAVMAGRMLAPRIGTWQTLLAMAVVAGIAVAIAGWLLKTSTTGAITWKNRVAGLLAPWGWQFAGGKLGRGLAASWLVWVLLVVPGVLTAGGSSPAASAALATPGVTSSNIYLWLLVIAWVVDGGALLYVAGVHAKNFSLGSSGSLSLLKVCGFIGGMLCVSAAFYLTGHPWPALLVAGGPPLALSAVAGLYVLIVLTAGKNARWN